MTVGGVRCPVEAASWSREVGVVVPRFKTFKVERCPGVAHWVLGIRPVAAGQPVPWQDAFEGAPGVLNKCSAGPLSNCHPRWTARQTRSSRPSESTDWRGLSPSASNPCKSLARGAAFGLSRPARKACKIVGGFRPAGKRFSILLLCRLLCRFDGGVKFGFPCKVRHGFDSAAHRPVRAEKAMQQTAPDLERQIQRTYEE
jgi:hypothetical protein